jgi:hypothetical protein
VERSGGEIEGQRPPIKQILGAGFIGTTIEGYDFFLYGTTATLVFGQLFFPTGDQLISTYLVAASGGNCWPVVVWMSGLCIITLASVLVAAETFRGGEFAAEQPGERRTVAEYS